MGVRWVLSAMADGTAGEATIKFVLPLGTCLTPKFLFPSGGPLNQFTGRRGPKSKSRKAIQAA